MDENKEMLEKTESAKPIDAKDKIKALRKEKAEKQPKKSKKQKIKKLRSQLMLKRGSYAVAITALFVAAVIVVNVLVAALADRFNLEFDLSTDKVNTMEEENIDYIKKIDKDITITVCASEENYTSYMYNYIQSSYSLSDDYSDYYNQTLKLINKYPDYNDKITVKFVDMYNDASFDAIQQKYSNEGLVYGDIIVSTVAEVNGKETERYKVIKFNEIYNISEGSSDDYYSMMMGYSSSSITGNNIETALTSAIVYVLGNDVKKVAILSGHGSADITTYVNSYTELLKDNNFEVEVVSTVPVLEIPKDTDVIALLAPVTDLSDAEVDVIVKFLDNNGELGKGLVYFGSSVCPKLPNLSELLADWDIQLAEGKVFMTDSSYCISGDPLTINTPVSYSSTIVTSGNQPIIAEDKEDGSVSTIKTAPYAVIAPIDAASNWTGYSKDDLGELALIAMSTKKDYNDDNKEISSNVIVFSSLDFIASQWAEEQTVYNKNFTLSLSQTAVQAEDTGIDFVSKSITNESFSSQVTDSASATVRIIFMIVLPLVMLALGLFIFIKRKDS